MLSIYKIPVNEVIFQSLAVCEVLLVRHKQRLALDSTVASDKLLLQTQTADCFDHEWLIPAQTFRLVKCYTYLFKHLDRIMNRSRSDTLYVVSEGVTDIIASLSYYVTRCGSYIVGH